MKSLEQEVAAFTEANINKKMRLLCWSPDVYAIPNGDWRVNKTKGIADNCTFRATMQVDPKLPTTLVNLYYSEWLDPKKWEYVAVDNGDISLDKVKVAADSCNHKWSRYVGFTEAFIYCIICDERK